MSSHRYAGAVSYTYRYINSSSLKRILILTSNQWSSKRTGVMCSNLGQHITTLAAIFCRHPKFDPTKVRTYEPQIKTIHFMSLEPLSWHTDKQKDIHAERGRGENFLLNKIFKLYRQQEIQFFLESMEKFGWSDLQSQSLHLSASHRNQRYCSLYLQIHL